MPPRRSRTPHNDRLSPLDAVSRLIEERDKYDQWLEELEAKKDSTPTKVFDRVRKDYLERLQAVMDQLKQHTAVLQEHAANMVAKLRELEASEQKITDELAETELRAQVGEITDAEWEATSRKAQREVGKLKENQELIADDLIKIRDILSDDDHDEDEDESPRTSADFDELEFLKSVVGTTSGGTPVSNPKVKAGDQAPARREPTPQSAPAQATTPRATPSSTPPVAKAAKAPEASEAEKAPAAAPKKAPPREAAPDNALGIRTSEAQEQPKTLKCPECGTMNIASEWYCERCGAELAAI